MATATSVPIIGGSGPGTVSGVIIPNKGEKDSPENIASLVSRDKLTKNTFYITYGLLMTTATITFIEALRTDIAAIRHIMNLETCISLVAGYFYSTFINTIQQSITDDKPIEPSTYQALNMTRYTDWAITTPIMLLALMLALQFNKTGRGTIPFILYISIILLNYGMLGSGYAAETNIISKRDGLVFGFIFLFVMFGLIYSNFVMETKGKNWTINIILFTAVIILWSSYGGVYLVEDDATKNTYYNILDLSSKCLVGIFLWAFFTGILA